MAKKMIQPLAGPFAGKRISVDEKDADSAIKEGWAVDPYDPEAKEPKDFDRDKAAVAAEKAARRWRGGEDEPAEPAKKAEAKPAEPAKDRSVEAEKPAAEDTGYKTRSKK